MKIVKNIPYSERRIDTNSGTAIIWPFLNVDKGDGPYELFLDTNALKNVKWFEQMPETIRTNSIINPWPAIQEQWLSNPQFQESTIDRINDMTNGLAKLGAEFRNQYASDQSKILSENHDELRTQFSLIIPYVAIMKSLLAKNNSVKQSLSDLATIVQKDIPRFTSAILLITLGILLKSKQSIKLGEDLKPAFSYLESFLSFQPKQKGGEDHMSISYLRNRAGDLNLWLSLPMLYQNGYNFVGTPAIVTGDRALHSLILRVIPPVLQENKTMRFTIASEILPANFYQQITDIITKIEVRDNITANEQQNRMSNLFDVAKNCCTDGREKSALDQIFSEWSCPALGKK